MFPADDRLSIPALLSTLNWLVSFFSPYTWWNRGRGVCARPHDVTDRSSRRQLNVLLKSSRGRCNVTRHRGTSQPSLETTQTSLNVLCALQHCRRNHCRSFLSCPKHIHTLPLSSPTPMAERPQTNLTADSGYVHSHMLAVLIPQWVRLLNLATWWRCYPCNSNEQAVWKRYQFSVVYINIT